MQVPREHPEEGETKEMQDETVVLVILVALAAREV